MKYVYALVESAATEDNSDTFKAVFTNEERANRCRDRLNTPSSDGLQRAYQQYHPYVVEKIPLDPTDKELEKL